MAPAAGGESRALYGHQTGGRTGFDPLGSTGGVDYEANVDASLGQCRCVDAVSTAAREQLPVAALIRKIVMRLVAPARRR